MTTSGISNWRTRKFAYSSFAVSSVEMSVFVSADVLAFTSSGHQMFIRRGVAAAWLFLTPTCIGLAIAGMIADSRPGKAQTALIVAVAVSAFCTVQVLV